jgi:hypothetical protein
VPTDSDGKFRFKRLAPGKYKARTWIEGLADPVETAITVKDGENQLEVDGHGAVASELGTDKFGVPRGAAAH